MATPYPYVSGAVLTAAQLNDGQNLPINDVTANYVLVNNDRYKRVIMNNAGSTTITVNNNVFVTGDVIQISNKGAGSTVVTAGAGVTVNTAGSLTLAQYGGGYLLALSASTFTFFSGGAPVYGTATGGIGAPTAVTISGVNYQYLTFTSTGTLTITRAGFFDYLAVGGGSGSAYNNGAAAGGGGGAGAIVIGSIYLSTNQTVTIGAGSSFGSIGTLQQGGNTSIAATSPFTQYAPGAANFVRSTGHVYGFTGSGTGGAGEASIAITTPLGFNGGSGGTYGGGGGGFGGVGQPSSGSSDGGPGFDVSVFIGGSALYKASGGGGGGRASNGGSSLGNNGTNTATPSNAAANTGCGGGAGAYVTTTGNGGSGICYIRWKV